jgi:hypothetical protein
MREQLAATPEYERFARRSTAMARFSLEFDNAG